MRLMRYSREHKEASRERIVHAAAHLFRKHGYHATGIDQVVEAAGLTPGGFYKHFPSKGGLLAAALERAASSSLRLRNTGIEHLRGERWLRSFVASYLSLEHARDVAEGCPIAALAPELTKGSTEERRALDAAVETTVAAISERLEGSTTDRRRAWGVLASCVGTLSLFRSVREPKLARRLLEEGRARAVSAGTSRTPRSRSGRSPRTSPRRP